MVAAAARAVGVAPRAALDGLATLRAASAGASSARARPAAWSSTTTTATIPTAIRETLAAVRQREPGRRVWAVYEPLTFHRTAALLDEFAAALAEADAVAIADIWAGRDPDTTIASAAGPRRAPWRPAGRASRWRAPGLGRGDRRVAGRTRSVPGDAVLVMGGGRSYRIGELLLERLG